MAPSNDLRIPTSSSATLMGDCGHVLLLRDHTRDVPVHLPEPAVIDSLARRDPHRAGGVLERSRVDMLAGDNCIALGHYLVDRLIRHHGVAARYIGSAVLDAREGP